MIGKKEIGRCEAGAVYAWELDNGKGLRATVLSLGGAIQKLVYKDVDVVLGYDTAEEYVTGTGYFGAIIGRVANRVAEAELTVEGISWPLTANRPPHTIHGGAVGFDKRNWQGEAEGDTLVLRLHSPHEEEGFPGAVDVEVRYTLTADNSLRIDYRAVPDRVTAVNLTNHAYFNLNGGGSVLEHTLWLDAEQYTPTDELGIPTGELAAVEGTFLDFRVEKSLTVGIDHNFCLNGSGLRKAAVVRARDITMEVETTAEGMQVYCASLSKARKGKDGASYLGPCFVCLEAQGYPDAMHHDNFPSILVSPEEPYAQTTIYRFI